MTVVALVGITCNTQITDAQGRPIGCAADSGCGRDGYSGIGIHEKSIAPSPSEVNRDRCVHMMADGDQTLERKRSSDFMRFRRHSSKCHSW